MFDSGFNNEVLYPQSTFGGYFSSTQAKVAENESLKWEIPNIDKTPWSDSDQTLSPMSASSQDFYSPSMFEPVFDFGAFPEEALDSSMTASNTSEEQQLSSPVFWQAAEVDVKLFDTSENCSFQPDNFSQSQTQLPRVDPIEQKHPLKDGSESTSTSGKVKLNSRTPRITRSSNSSASSPAPSKRIKATSSKRKPAKRQASVSSPLSSSDHGSPSGALDPQTRTNHNLIERKYRNRLNGQFETLLAVLPASGEDFSRDEETEKRISKAEILTLAKEHIEALERDREELEDQRHKLREKLEILQMTHNSTTVGCH